MKKCSINIIYLSFTLFILSCENKNLSKADNTIIDSISSVKDHDSISVIDTIIVLKKDVTSFKERVLTSKIAKSILYNHFRKKGYLIQEELKGISKNNESEICVLYDTIFKLKNSSSAIISYWLSPPYSSGHCFQPSKAIIINTDNGYKITNEDFIPTSFAIDSVKTISNNDIIFGYEYDCVEDNVIRKLIITLK